MRKDSKNFFSLKIQLIIMETNIQIQQTMTSLEIAELTGKQHKNLMRDIRNMEPAWEKVNGLKFELIDYQLNSEARLSPHFTLGELTKSSHREVYNIPSHEAIENLKRVCSWLEVLLNA